MPILPTSRGVTSDEESEYSGCQDAIPGIPAPPCLPPSQPFASQAIRGSAPDEEVGDCEPWGLGSKTHSGHRISANSRLTMPFAYPHEGLSLAPSNGKGPWLHPEEARNLEPLFTLIYRLYIPRPQPAGYGGAHQEIPVQGVDLHYRYGRAARRRWFALFARESIEKRLTAKGLGPIPNKVDHISLDPDLYSYIGSLIFNIDTERRSKAVTDELFLIFKEVKENLEAIYGARSGVDGGDTSPKGIPETSIPSLLNAWFFKKSTRPPFVPLDQETFLPYQDGFRTSSPSYLKTANGQNFNVQAIVNGIKQSAFNLLNTGSQSHFRESCPDRVFDEIAFNSRSSGNKAPPNLEFKSDSEIDQATLKGSTLYQYADFKQVRKLNDLFLHLAALWIGTNGGVHKLIHQSDLYSVFNSEAVYHNEGSSVNHFLSCHESQPDSTRLYSVDVPLYYRDERWGFHDGRFAYQVDRIYYNYTKNPARVAQYAFKVLFAINAEMGNQEFTSRFKVFLPEQSRVLPEQPQVHASVEGVRDLFYRLINSSSDNPGKSASIGFIPTVSNAHFLAKNYWRVRWNSPAAHLLDLDGQIVMHYNTEKEYNTLRRMIYGSLDSISSLFGYEPPLRTPAQFEASDRSILMLCATKNSNYCATRNCMLAEYPLVVETDNVNLKSEQTHRPHALALPPNNTGVLDFIYRDCRVFFEWATSTCGTLTILLFALLAASYVSFLYFSPYQLLSSL